MSVSQKQRAQFELRKLGLPTAELTPVRDESSSYPGWKRRKIDGSSRAVTSGGPSASRTDTVKVVRLAWLQDSILKGRLLDYTDYLVYEAVKESKQATKPTLKELMRRARDVAAGSSQDQTPQRGRDGRHRDLGHHVKAPPLVPHSTTDEDVITNLPPVPGHLKTSFSCQRSTQMHPPNWAFIEKLKGVRELRAIQGDDIGVRAYSSAIASLSAYPYKLQSAIGEREQWHSLHSHFPH